MTAAATFVPLESGRRCINVEATADGGQRASGESCATVLNRVVPVPSVTATITGRDVVATGETRIFKYRIVNNGQVPLRNVRIAVAFDPQLKLIRATEGNDPSRLSQFQIVWNVPEMKAAGDATSTVLLEGEFQATQVNARSTMILTVSSAEGARADDTLNFQITQGVLPSRPAPLTSPALPPIAPTPLIPDAPAPLPPTSRPPAVPPTMRGPITSPTGPIGTTLSLSLLDRDDPVRVNQPIRYALSVTNNSNQFDGNVGIRFLLPPGVQLSRVSQRLAPGGVGTRTEGNTIYLDDIRDLRPQETVNYDLELVSNQPQDLELVVEALSRLMPGGTSASQRTRVIQ